jgi:hypothetical protein
MNEDELLELTYRNPIKIRLKDVLSQEVFKISESKLSPDEKIAALEKLKLEIMAKNPQVMGVPIPDTHTKKGIMTRYGKKCSKKAHNIISIISQVNLSNEE